MTNIVSIEAYNSEDACNMLDEPLVFESNEGVLDYGDPLEDPLNVSSEDHRGDKNDFLIISDDSSDSIAIVKTYSGKKKRPKHQKKLLSEKSYLDRTGKKVKFRRNRSLKRLHRTDKQRMVSPLTKRSDNSIPTRDTFTEVLSNTNKCLTLDSETQNSCEPVAELPELLLHGELIKSHVFLDNRLEDFFSENHVCDIGNENVECFSNMSKNLNNESSVSLPNCPINSQRTENVELYLDEKSGQLKPYSENHDVQVFDTSKLNTELNVSPKWSSETRPRVPKSSKRVPKRGPINSQRTENVELYLDEKSGQLKPYSENHDVQVFDTSKLNAELNVSPKWSSETRPRVRKNKNCTRRLSVDSNSNEKFDLLKSQIDTDKNRRLNDSFNEHFEKLPICPMNSLTTENIEQRLNENSQNKNEETSVENPDNLGLFSENWGVEQDDYQISELSELNVDSSVSSKQSSQTRSKVRKKSGRRRQSYQDSYVHENFDLIKSPQIDLDSVRGRQSSVDRDSDKDFLRKNEEIFDGSHFLAMPNMSNLNVESSVPSKQSSQTRSRVRKKGRRRRRSYLDSDVDEDFDLITSQSDSDYASGRLSSLGSDLNENFESINRREVRTKTFLKREERFKNSFENLDDVNNTFDIEKQNEILMIAWKIQIDYLKRQKGKKRKCDCKSVYNFQFKKRFVKTKFCSNYYTTKPCCELRKIILGPVYEVPIWTKTKAVLLPET